MSSFFIYFSFRLPSFTVAWKIYHIVFPLWLLSGFILSSCFNAFSGSLCIGSYCISEWHQSCALRLIACGVFISAVPAWFVSYYVLIGSLVVSVVFLSLLCTSMSLMFLFRLYDIIGVSGHKILSFGSFSMTCQCRLKICPMWVVFVLYGILNVSGMLVLLFSFSW